MASLNDEYQQIEEHLRAEKKEHASLKERFEALEERDQIDASIMRRSQKKKLEVKIIDLQNELNEEQDKQTLMEEGNHIKRLPEKQIRF